MSPALFALMALGTYRITRVLIIDKILDVPRTWIKQRTSIQVTTSDNKVLTWAAKGWRGYVYKLITCFWCVAFWIGGAITWAVHHYEPFDHFALIWLGVAVVAPLVRLVEELVEATRDALDRTN